MGMSVAKGPSQKIVSHSTFFLQTDQLTRIKREEQEMLETQSIPLRNYLMKNVMPTLTQGLIEVCKVKPDDPVDYLVSSLLSSQLLGSNSYSSF